MGQSARLWVRVEPLLPALKGPMGHHLAQELRKDALVPFQGTLALSSCRVDGLLVMVQAWPLEVVEVGRQPEVFVRPFEPDEAQRSGVRGAGPKIKRRPPA